MLNLELKKVQLDGIDMTDYPRFCDAYISYAEWPNGRELTDEEYEALDWDYTYNLVCEKVIEGWLQKWNI